MCICIYRYIGICLYKYIFLALELQYNTTRPRLKGLGGKSRMLEVSFWVQGWFRAWSFLRFYIRSYSVRKAESLHGHGLVEGIAVRIAFELLL